MESAPSQTSNDQRFVELLSNAFALSAEEDFARAREYIFAVPENDPEENWDNSKRVQNVFAYLPCNLHVSWPGWRGEWATWFLVVHESWWAFLKSEFELAIDAYEFIENARDSQRATIFHVHRTFLEIFRAGDVDGPDVPCRDIHCIRDFMAFAHKVAGCVNEDGSIGFHRVAYHELAELWGMPS